MYTYMYVYVCVYMYIYVYIYIYICIRGWKRRVSLDTPCCRYNHSVDTASMVLFAAFTCLVCVRPIVILRILRPKVFESNL